MFKTVESAQNFAVTVALEYTTNINGYDLYMDFVEHVSVWWIVSPTLTAEEIRTFAVRWFRHSVSAA